MLPANTPALPPEQLERAAREVIPLPWDSGAGTGCPRWTSGAGIMEADDRQVTTVVTVQHHSTIGTRQTEYHEELPSSANVQPHFTLSFTDDGNAS